MSDNRRDQLIEFVEREFIGPDPIDWPGMTQSKHRLTRAHREKQLKMSCQALHNAPPNRT